MIIVNVDKNENISIKDLDIGCVIQVDGMIYMKLNNNPKNNIWDFEADIVDTMGSNSVIEKILQAELHILN